MKKYKFGSEKTADETDYLENFIDTLSDIFINQRVSLKVGKFIMLIHYVQLYSLLTDTKDFFLPGNDDFELSNPEDLLYNLIDLFKYISIYRLYNNVPTIFLIVFIIFGISALLFTATGISLIFYPKFPEGLRQKILIKLSKVSILYDQIFFLPFQITFLYSVNFSGDKNIIFNDEIKGSGIAIFQCIIGAIFLVSNILNGFILSFFYLNPVDDGNVMAKRDNAEEKTLFFYKVLLSTLIYLLNLNSKVYSALRIIFCVFVFGYLYIREASLPVFYDKKISFHSMSLKGLGFCMSLSLLIKIMIVASKEKFDPHLCFALTFLTAPFLSKMGKNFICLRIQKIFTKESGELLSTEEIILKYVEFARVSKKISKSIELDGAALSDSEYALKGLVSKHISSCVDTHCICYRKERLYDPNSNRFCNMNKEAYLDSAYLLHFGRMILSDGVKRFNGDTYLEIIHACYQAIHMKFVHQAFIILQSVEHRHKNIKEKQMIAFTLKQIKKILNCKYDERSVETHFENTKSAEFIDSFSLLEIEEKIIEFKDLMFQSIDQSIEFWDLLSKNQIVLQNISKMSHKIEALGKKIDAKFQQIRHVRHSLQDFHHLVYGLFLSTILNDINEGSKCIKEAYTLAMGNSSKAEKTRGISPASLNDKDTVCIMISGEKHKLGIITECNHNLRYVFGRREETVVQKNIEELMPPVFRIYHSKYIHGYLDTGQETILNKKRKVFGLHEKGHCFPADIYVKLNPDISKGMCYLGLIKPIKTYDYYIVTDFAGLIDSISKNLGEVLGLHPTIFLKERFTLNQICPQLTEVLEAFNYNAYKIYGEKIFLDYKPMAKSETTSQYIKGSHYDAMQKLINKNTFSTLPDGTTQERHEIFRKAFASAEGVKITITVPSYMKKYSDNGQEAKEEVEKSCVPSILLNDAPPTELAEEFTFSCSIEENVYKGRQLIRILRLKQIIGSEDGEAQDLAIKSSSNLDFENSSRGEIKDVNPKSINIDDHSKVSLEQFSKSPKNHAFIKSRTGKVKNFSYLTHMATHNQTQIEEERENSESRVSIASSCHVSSILDFRLHESDVNQIQIHYTKDYLNQSSQHLNAHTRITETKVDLNDTSLLNITTDNLNKTTAPLNKKNEMELSIMDENIIAERNNEHRQTNRSNRPPIRSVVKLEEKVQRHEGTISRAYYLKKKFRLEHIDHNADDGSSRSSSTKSQKSFYRLYIKSLEEEYLSPSFKQLTRSVNLIILASIALCFVIYFVNRESIGKIKLRVEIQRTSGDINYFTLSNFRRFKSIELLADGDISNDRFTGFNQSNYFDVTKSWIVVIIDTLRNLTSEFYNQLDQFENSIQNSIYDDPLHIVRIDELTGNNIIVQLDFFQLAHDIIASNSKFLKYTFQDVLENKDRIRSLISSIYDNSGNSLLIICDETEQRLNDEITNTNNLILTLSYAICGSMIGIVICAFLVYIYIFFKLSYEKEAALSTFLMIETDHINATYEFLRRFRTILKTCEENSDHLLEEYDAAKSNWFNNNIIKFKRKKAHKYGSGMGIFQLILQYLLRIFLLFSTTFIFFIYFMLNFNSFINNNSKIVNQLFVTQKTMINQTYLWEAVRLLVSENGTAVLLDKTPLEVYNEYLGYVSSTSTISEAYYGPGVEFDSQLDTYLKGDLCIDLNDSNCYKVAQGSMSKGLLQYDNYFVNVLTRIYTNWNEKRTNYDKKAILDQTDFLDLEYSFVYIARSRYLNILNYLMARFNENNTTQTNNSTISVIIFILIEVFAIIVIWIPLYEILKKEQIHNKIMFKLIPPDIVLKNSYIKLHLKRISEKTLAAYSL